MVEKARLQSEAKAVEDARRKAEEEAAAEARRKIELEREAARQALQKVKFLDIPFKFQAFLKKFILTWKLVSPSGNLTVHTASFQMEKTVDINEHIPCIEDLKLFRVVPDVHLQSFCEERNPDHSQEEEGLCSFNFQATSKPLEQLGLYMIHEEEEEEEAEPKSLPSNDPEEGEID